ncbi:MAG: LTA synthase family protein [Sodaliphilus sp.]|nr:LTA synthase family protein [Sodaliphilus sp.]
MTTTRKIIHSNICAAAINMLVAYAVFMLTRVAFFAVNSSTYAPYMSWPLAANMLKGALVFDTSALLYINALYLVLTLLPLHLKEFPKFQNVLKWIFVVTNAAGAASNLIDSVYFQYTGRRSTITVFSEFTNESNIGSIFLTEFVNHWYLVLAFAVLVTMLWKCFVTARVEVFDRGWKYYTTQLISLALVAPMAIIGIRGSATAGTRPITISNANEYVNRPVESVLVLNTPFSIIRSIGKKVYVTPHYMTLDQMAKTYQPIITPKPDSLSLGKKNVVILIMESMGKEYIGSLNPTLEGGHYKGYMPFVDSLVAKSLTFKYSYANGRISMDAMPSVLSSIPMFVEPFFLTPASLNKVSGVASMLAPKGYYSAFFHGGHNISMGFGAFAHAIGYKDYFGLNEYCKSPKYHGMDDFDGKWAIWDEPFFQFTLDEMEHFKQPFVTTVFSASSHHPYKVPAQYANVYREEGGLPIHKCIRYTDMALRKFFERAARQPWYKNTIFVIVADHTNLNKHAEYKTDLGLYSIPILFYTPDGSIKPGMRTDVIAQQIDIMPTLMHLLGYDKPYVAFGSDLLSTPPQDTWAVNYNNGIYQYLKGDYMIQFDGQNVKAAYRFKSDPLLQHNIVGKVPQQNRLETELKAIIQQYMWRMNENKLQP